MSSAGYRGGSSALALPGATRAMPPAQLQFAMARRVRGSAAEGVGEAVREGVGLGEREALGGAPCTHAPRTKASSTRSVEELQLRQVRAQQKSGLPSAAGGKVRPRGEAGKGAKLPSSVEELGPKRVKVAPESVL